METTVVGSVTSLMTLSPPPCFFTAVMCFVDDVGMGVVAVVVDVLLVSTATVVLLEAASNALLLATTANVVSCVSSVSSMGKYNTCTRASFAEIVASMRRLVGRLA